MWNVKSDVFRKNETEENMAYASIILRIVPPAVVLGTRTTWNERYVPGAIIAHGRTDGRDRLTDWLAVLEMILASRQMLRWWCSWWSWKPCEPKQQRMPCAFHSTRRRRRQRFANWWGLFACVFLSRELEWLFSSLAGEKSSTIQSYIFFYFWADYNE